MEMENEEGDGRVRRAEIETSAPFKSVKEAVMLFGERVLVGEVYANKLNQIGAASMIKNEHHAPLVSSVVAELEETKQSLEKLREEREVMANYLSSLKEDLEQTKMELKQLKCRQQAERQVIDSKIEQLKYVGNVTEADIKVEELTRKKPAKEFQKKRSVKFANPPSLTQVINPEEEVLFERQFSVDGDVVNFQEKESRKKKKKKKKKLVPLIAAVFTSKKGSSPKTSGSNALVQEV